MPQLLSQAWVPAMIRDHLLTLSLRSCGQTCPTIAAAFADGPHVSAHAACLSTFTLLTCIQLLDVQLPSPERICVSVKGLFM